MIGPRVTVAIPSIPGRSYSLSRAVESAATQTRPPDAIVVVMDHERNGAHWARNRALAMIDTEWVAWLDDDDILLPNHLEVCVSAAIAGRADLVYPGMITEGGRDPLATPVNGRLRDPFGVRFGPEQEHHLRTVGNFIPITNLVRAELVRQVGGFPKARSEEFAEEEDYGLLIRLLDAGARFVHAPVRTWRYRFHASNTGGRGRDEIDQIPSRT
jgi:glycosyltransferase involved in cell wall biosynthesis